MMGELLLLLLLIIVAASAAHLLLQQMRMRKSRMFQFSCLLFRRTFSEVSFLTLINQNNQEHDRGATVPELGFGAQVLQRDRGGQRIP